MYEADGYWNDDQFFYFLSSYTSIISISCENVENCHKDSVQNSNANITFPGMLLNFSEKQGPQNIHLMYKMCKKSILFHLCDGIAMATCG